jgi:hypothetical protein
MYSEAISRFGPTRFPDLGPTFPEFPAELRLVPF